ncbi:HupE/UreJ family protein [Pandoraea communis]|uniref:Urease accessory protein UreJ n=1 Tax=Pandoraea communis TaxID=2508297 RepID=A0A5E4S5U1_9BURK|nr:HupE/UreJ family protein [Pandoraea communis]MDM8354563.1 HupE/UreJ family protein [Pandoraea communis]VVD69419.1 urease accessory protein UreJ [Pandoraea communis]
MTVDRPLNAHDAGEVSATSLSASAHSPRHAHRHLARAATGLALLAASGVALAHPGHPGHDAASSFAAGFLHPLTGADHLCAMIVVGLWSSLTSKRVWLAPVAFVAMLAAGGLLGMSHWFALPGVEPMIAVSLLVLGLMLATRAKLPGWAGAAIVGAFAIFHGFAHGAELPAEASAMHYMAGFLIATGMLHGIGIAAGVALRRRTAWVPRLLGAGVLAYGVSLLAAAA